MPTAPMPHPAKKTTGVTMSTRIILERPTLAALIGCVAAGWVHVEDGLERIYSILSSYHMPLTEGFEPSHHPIASQVFAEVIAVKSRLDLVHRLCKAVVPEQAEAFRKDVYDPMRRLASRRNAVVHGNWGVSADYPDKLVEMSDRWNWMVYDEKDLTAICDDIERLNDAVQSFWIGLMKHRKERASHDRMTLGEFRNWLFKELWRKLRHGTDDVVISVPKRGPKPPSG